MPITNCELGPDVAIPLGDLVNLYGCRIGADSRIGPFVEIQSGATVGARCKISSHAFICTGVTLEDEVFVGHGVMFTNDMYPASTNADGRPKGGDDWDCLPTVVQRGAAIGSNATILCGITIGAGATVGAGAVVTRDVAPGITVAGNPARRIASRGTANIRIAAGRDAS